MTVFKIIVLSGFVFSMLYTIAEKTGNERKYYCILTAILGVLFIAAEIATRILQ